MKNTLLFMVDQLKADDRLCIITFQSTVHRVLPLSALTEENKKKAKTLLLEARKGMTDPAIVDANLELLKKS